MTVKFQCSAFTCLLAGCLALLAGCAATVNPVTTESRATREKYEAKLNSWLQADINTLVKSWGPPSGEFKVANGNKVYVYQGETSRHVPARSHPLAGNLGNFITGGDSVQIFWCKTFFEVGADNRIVQWRFEGNNCKSE